ncbi:MAG: DUF2071 domain-containing protein [Verrucomicrobiota bacterium]|nr:DUF2071 domain-containing protein [Verrucomicrobiota bacterium]
MGPYWLKRHPFPVVAHFEYSLVLTYAFERAFLQSLIPSGLELDTLGDNGFVALAFVQTKGLRPAFLPTFFGRNFFLAGFRVFVRHRTRNGRRLRGLRILKSLANRRMMCFAGNLLTHYNYEYAKIKERRVDQHLEIEVECPRMGAGEKMNINVDLSPCEQLPPQSPFENMHQARLFAGPMPFTFDYESETHSIVRIEGVRSEWRPKPVQATVTNNFFLNSPPFKNKVGVLANAFIVENVPYRWERGIREKLPETAAR